jgi:hypothetical protein
VLRCNCEGSFRVGRVASRELLAKCGPFPAKATHIPWRPYCERVSNPLRSAYRDAWLVRDQTGDDSPALLLDKLKVHGADSVWFQPDAEAHKWILDCWARAVAPRGLAMEAAKEMGTLVPRIVKPIRELLRNLR